MKVATGFPGASTGKSSSKGNRLAEGTKVTVVSREDEESLRPDTGMKGRGARLTAEIERGEYITADELLERLRRFG